MSGGHFDYLQYKLQDAYIDIEEQIYGKSIEEYEVDDYCNDRFLDEDVKKYIKEHLATPPNKGEYSKETLKEFKNAIHYLKLAEIYLQRIDWLFSGDDSEETFHKRLKNDLDKLKAIK